MLMHITSFIYTDKPAPPLDDDEQIHLTTGHTPCQCSLCGTPVKNEDFQTLADHPETVSREGCRQHGHYQRL